MEKIYAVPCAVLKNTIFFLNRTFWGPFDKSTIAWWLTQLYHIGKNTFASMYLSVSMCCVLYSLPRKHVWDLSGWKRGFFCSFCCASGLLHDSLHSVWVCQFYPHSHWYNWYFSSRGWLMCLFNWLEAFSIL